eukprot:TRINITY_DN19941_c0_g1_i4.p1 TRINITY_DN19941_c0_g1~~TRINITY_DN19941_c0_g1_i4.p1  ORF type:complete len:100 (-),score=17.23 TRINITY_DN19941_c0_g1_i4:125-385(-)
MDFQFTFSQMVDLCRAPSEVYKTTQFRKQIKNQWARDDPAFVVVMIFFLLMATSAYCVTFFVSSFTSYLTILARCIFVDFLGLQNS